MFLKSIVIDGFKSFAKKRELLIKEGITGIVGPNGSGKSNIADAMRWVLGEQSSRNLRGSNMQEVIFKGTQTRPAKSRCEVSLLFDNTDGHFNVPYAEVIVRRRLYRSGESEYSINGTSCRLKDVIALFRDTGLGRDGYSIIGQGRISQILDSRAGERRQVFDEAAGIMKYRSRKEEAERNLRKTQDNIDRVGDIIAELQTQVGPLEEQMKAAREHRQLADELRGLEVNLILHTAAELQVRIAALEQAKAEQEQAQREAAASQDDAADKRNGAREAVKALQAQLDALTAERQQAAGRAEHARTQLALCAQRARDCQAALQEALERRNRLVERQQSAQERRQALIPEIETLRQRLAELQSAVSGSADLHSDEAPLRAQREETRVRLGEVRAELGRRMQAAMEEQRGAGSAAAEVARLRAEQRELAARSDTLAEAGAAARRGGEEAARRALKLQEEARAAEEKQRSVNAELEALQEALQEIDRQLSSITAKANLIGEMQDSHDGYYDSVRALFKALRQLPELAGEVYGTVADAIRVDGKLEAAIDTALGSAAQNVIVTTDTAARDLIELLRSRRLGRVTFLPVQALNVRRLDAREEQTVRSMRLLGSASDLISCDAAVRPAIDYLLARTVIAGNLDEALEVKRPGLNSFRLVTLAGDIVVPGGAITGGSQRRSRVSLLSRRRMRDELEKSRVQLAERRSALAARCEQAEQDLRTLAGRMRQTQVDFQTVRVDLARFQTEAGRIGEAADEVRQRQTSCADDLRTALALQANRSAEQAAADAAMQSLRQEQDSLETMLDRIETDLDQAQSAREKRQAASAALEAELAAVRAGLAPKEKAAAQAEADAVQAADELEALDAHVQTRREELRENETEQQQAQQTLAESQTESARIEAETETVQRRHKREEENADFYEQQMHDAGVQANEGNRELYRLDAELDKTRAQLGMQSDRLWQEHELTWANAETLRVDPFSPQAARQRAAGIRKRLGELGAVNPNAVDDYDRVQTRLQSLLDQREDLSAASRDLEVVIAELMGAMRTTFEKRFQAINDAFSRSFRELFGGGSACLTLEEGVPVMEAGVNIQAEPPGKKLQNINLLSGGEKALTAIALCMAMLEVNPSPICLLDEIDAPLDDKNVVRLSEYLAKMKDRLQFLVITHKKQTMSVCDTLYGVAMHEKGVTDIVSVALDDVQPAAAEEA